MSGGQNLWLRRSLYRITWSSFDAICVDLANQLYETHFAPDVIVGISRGGLIPAVRMSHLLGTTHLGVVSVSRNKSSLPYPERVSPANGASLLPDITGKTVLLVDDIAGSGETLDYAKALLPQQAGLTKTATLMSNRLCSSRPDYYIHDVDDWVVFPWEKDPPTCDNMEVRHL